MLALLKSYRLPVHVPTATMSGEDLAVAIKALQRSSEAMPDATETFLSREVRQAREVKLANRLRQAISRSL
jgi:hypothetical protein